MPLDPAQERVVRLLTADVVATLGEPHDDVLQWELANVLELADSLDDFTERLVEGVQQVFHDTFVDTTWPACPRHPNHPLWFRDGAWWCERDGVSIFALGALPTRPTAGEAR